MDIYTDIHEGNIRHKTAEKKTDRRGAYGHLYRAGIWAIHGYLIWGIYLCLIFLRHIQAGHIGKKPPKKSEGAASPREAWDYLTHGPSGQAAPLHPASFP